MWYDTATFAVDDARLTTAHLTSLDLSNPAMRSAVDGLTACPYVYAHSRVMMISGRKAGTCILMDFTTPSKARHTSFVPSAAVLLQCSFNT